MITYYIVGKDTYLKVIGNFLRALGYHVEEKENFDNIPDYSTILIDDMVEATYENNKYQIFKFYNFLNIILKEFVTLGFYENEHIYTTLLGNYNSFNDDGTKISEDTEYMIFKHDKLHHYELNYMIITYPDNDITRFVRDISKYNIIYGDNLVSLPKRENIIYFGTRDDSDYIITNLDRDEKYIMFDLKYKNKVLDRFKVNAKYEKEIKEVIGIIIYHYLEEIDLDMLKLKLIEG